MKPEKLCSLFPPQTPARGVEHRTAPRYEEVERQYASLPRRGPSDPVDYPMQAWPGPYSGAPNPPRGYPQPGQAYPSSNPQPGQAYPSSNPQPGQAYPGFPPSQAYLRPGDQRGMEPGYYPHLNPRHHPHPQAQPPQAQHPPRGPLRQDVPPSPPLRGQRYDTMTRGPGGGAYRPPREPDQYGYPGEGGNRQNQPDPRPKNPMTAAV
ncbi:hypothetical protein NHX12_006786 [Muraenolepis orangiensis]|uniref:Uncharacterized protein n=1 Tax=Muraenolepis orangiensis TaxID=630683 RepID=A0A9Q0IAH7_9TELE|nr:hypothetical protein NHX12_006786 [Muraenolepis orangiensis]